MQIKGKLLDLNWRSGSCELSHLPTFNGKNNLSLLVFKYVIMLYFIWILMYVLSSYSIVSLTKYIGIRLLRGYLKIQLSLLSLKYSELE